MASPTLRGRLATGFLKFSPQDLANADANDDPGLPWIHSDSPAIRQQVGGRMWTVLDTLDLATDQKAGGSNPSERAHVMSQDIEDTVNPHWVTVFSVSGLVVGRWVGSRG